MTIDLHCHSTNSDGIYTIKELTDIAKKAGLNKIAVSDHCTFTSAKFAYEHPEYNGVGLIPATELTSYDAKRNRFVHILGYFPKGVMKDKSYNYEADDYDAASFAKRIKENGCIVVIAHPELYNSLDLCSELAAAGSIDGIEISHPTTTPKGQQAAKEIAKKYGLLTTGGSDYHGYAISYHPKVIGACRTDDKSFDEIIALAKKRGLYY